METSSTMRKPITSLHQRDLSYTCVIEENDHEKQKEEDKVRRKKCAKRGVGEKLQSMILHKRGKSKSVEKMCKYFLWRQFQKTSATRLEKQLKARWELENLIDEQLKRFHAHYNGAMVPHTLKDVAQLLMPGWTPPYELATLSWLGDWRPSVILDLVHGLPRSSFSFKSHLLDSNFTERLLSQLLQEIRIEEAIIDSEMTEIQSTCILRLPFAPINDHLPGACLLSCIQAEFKKIVRVIIKAQQLRYKALELVVRKVLSPVDAAEFLVAFAGIQEAIHQYATKQKLPKGPLNAPRVKLLEVKSLTAMGNLPGNPKSVYKLRK